MKKLGRLEMTGASSVMNCQVMVAIQGAYIDQMSSQDVLQLERLVLISPRRTVRHLVRCSKFIGTLHIFCAVFGGLSFVQASRHAKRGIPPKVYIFLICFYHMYSASSSPVFLQPPGGWCYGFVLVLTFMLNSNQRTTYEAILFPFLPRFFWRRLRFAKDTICIICTF